jgi:hypothetical protein
MDHWVFVWLRLLHILAGVFWTGTAVFVALFLEPVVRGSGPAGGAVMHGLMQERHLSHYLTGAAWTTILAGIPVYWRTSGQLNGGWITSDPGLGYTAGALLAVGALLLGQFVNGPTAKRMGALGARLQQAGGPPTAAQAAELAALRTRLRHAARLGAGLLMLATAAMAVARYL